MVHNIIVVVAGGRFSQLKFHAASLRTYYCCSSGCRKTLFRELSQSFDGQKNLYWNALYLCGTQRPAMHRTPSPQQALLVLPL